MLGRGSAKGDFAGGRRGPKARDNLFNKLPPGSGLEAETGLMSSLKGWTASLPWPLVTPWRGAGVHVCVCVVVGMCRRGRGEGRGGGGGGHSRTLFTFVEVKELQTPRPHSKSHPPTHHLSNLALLSLFVFHVKAPRVAYVSSLAGD